MPQSAPRSARGPAAAGPAERPLLAILLMMAAVSCFPLMQACAKTLSQEHGISFVQAVWGRYFFHLLLVPVFFPRSLRGALATRRIGIQIARGLLLFVATLCGFLALTYLPIPQITALAFIAPLLVTALAAALLRETVTWPQWAAVGVGFAGVIVIVRPGGSMTWAAVLPLFLAAFYALYQILTRLVRHDVGPGASLFFSALVGAVVSCVAVPFFWTPPTPQVWALLVATALFGGFGQWLLIRAYQLTRASIVAPFGYFEMVSATGVSVTLFGQLPDRWTVVGALIIIGSGLYLARRERIGREAAPAD